MGAGSDRRIDRTHCARCPRGHAFRILLIVASRRRRAPRQASNIVAVSAASAAACDIARAALTRLRAHDSLPENTSQGEVDPAQVAAELSQRSKLPTDSDAPIPAKFRWSQNHCRSPALPSVERDTRSGHPITKPDVVLRSRRPAPPNSCSLSTVHGPVGSPPAAAGFSRADRSRKYGCVLKARGSVAIALPLACSVRVPQCLSAESYHRRGSAGFPSGIP